MVEFRTARKVLLFGDSKLVLSRILLEGFLCRLADSPDLITVGLCDTTGARTPLRAFLAEKEISLAHKVRESFNPRYRDLFPENIPTMRKLAKEFDLPLLSPPEGKINDPTFVSLLENKFDPDIALSCICLQIFQSHLLSIFDTAINYHNGLLPEYRGLRATCWSVYNREKYTGFTFHRMNAKIDDGPILLQNVFPLEDDSNPLQLDVQKILAACKRIPELIEMIVGGSDGEPQVTQGSYYSLRDFEAITTLSNPAEFTAEELLRRLQAFEILTVNIGGKSLPVTDLTVSSERHERLAFFSGDGFQLAIKRIRFLPPWLHFFYRFLREKQIRDS